ncbi:MAG: hypothetical protein KJO50_05390, partial [Bacteroidia bacterium]|nr:hypothetical protein [Bacteroidia bacterium]
MKLLNNMKKYQLFRSISLLCLITPLLIIAYKWTKTPNTFQHLYPGHIYTVTYEFDLSKLDKDVFVKAFLPRSNERQDIKDQTLHGNSYSFSKETNEFGDRGIWKVKDTRDIIISHQFKVESQSLKYELPDSMSYEFHYPSDIKQYLQPSDFIQSDHHLIDSIAKQLKGTELRSTLNSNFEFVKQITNSHTGILTDAITVLERQRASCNGKSRLFVALCRAQGIPAKLVGGIILEESRKRTSHLWAEVFYQNEWIPFDILNEHFAELPSNYLELYTGDHFLITHSKDISFDYQFLIDHNYSSAIAEANSYPLWNLVNRSNLPIRLWRGLLILPVAGLVIAIFRNVIGFKTFGIFLPALIGLALVNHHLWWGLFAMGIVILAVVLVHYPLEKIGMMHIPKVMIMMIIVILSIIGLSIIGVQNDWQKLGTTILLPIIILSITAERFAKTLVEEHPGDAFRILGNTML